MEASIKTALFALCAGGLALLAIGLLWRAPSSEFFADALREAHVQTDVVVSGRVYNVADGRVTRDDGGTPSRLVALKALRIAYAQSAARASPLLDISGTDPAALRASVRELSRAVIAISERQPTAREVFLVRASLYPLAFLDSLADVAEARARFLASGSDIDAGRYHAALDAALAEGRRSAQIFQNAHAEMTRARRDALASAGGTIVPEAVDAAKATVILRFDEARAAHTARLRCLRGKEGACDVGDITPALYGRQAVQRANSATTPIMREVEQIREEALDELVSADGYTIMATYSPCFALLPPPYYFDAGVGNYRPQFVGDIIFHPASSDSSGTMKYLHDEYGIDYVPSNHAVFYTCPEFQNDIGIISAVLAVAQFARSHPDVLQAQRSDLLSTNGIVRAGDAWRYLRDGLDLDDGYLRLPAEDQDAFLTLVHMMNNRTADLDVLVRQIAQVLRTDIEIHDGGAPFDITAAKLFLTHSAFPSLFLAFNPSAGETSVHIRRQSAGDIAAFNQSSILYSQIRGHIPREKIISDIEAFRAFERK